MFSALWVILLVVMIAKSDPVETKTLQYANAVLLAVTAAMVMAGLYNETRVSVTSL